MDMKQQYISPIAEVEVLCLEHYLQTDSKTITNTDGDTGYSGPGHGGGRAPEREEDETVWGDLW